MTRPARGRVGRISECTEEEILVLLYSVANWQLRERRPGPIKARSLPELPVARSRRGTAPASIIPDTSRACIPPALLRSLSTPLCSLSCVHLVLGWLLGYMRHLPPSCVSRLHHSPPPRSHSFRCKRGMKMVTHPSYHSHKQNVNSNQRIPCSLPNELVDAERIEMPYSCSRLEDDVERRRPLFNSCFSCVYSVG